MGGFSGLTKDFSKRKAEEITYFGHSHTHTHQKGTFYAKQAPFLRQDEAAARVCFQCLVFDFGPFCMDHGGEEDDRTANDQAPQGHMKDMKDLPLILSTLSHQWP